ncbi:MAG: ABC transporter substrate-binding protein [Planctomycetota bacterium]|nr:ABC transporter substrate-binding protein [Planctomycetota bacterium]
MANVRAMGGGRRRFLGVLAGVVAAAGCVLGMCGAAAAQGGAAEPILVGHYGSMTGKEATFGQSTDRGIQLAIKDINAAGGLNGRPIQLKTYDTKGESKEAGIAVTRLITDDKVVAVLGEVASSLSLAGGAVCQQYGVPMISPSSTNPRVTAGRDMVFRVCFTDDQQAFAIARFVRENLKLERAAVLFDQTQAYSKGLKDDFNKSFKALGGTVVIEQAYSGGDTDFSAQLTSIKAADPQIIFAPGYYTDGGNIAIQARRLGIGKNVPLIGGDGWDSEQLGKIGGDAIEGAYYSNHTAPDQPGSGLGQFNERFRSEFGGATPDALAGLGYDAMMVLFDAMKRCQAATGGLKGKDLAKAIAETKDFPGVTGSITMDKNRNASKPVVMVQVKNGMPSWVANVPPKE